MPKIPLTTAAYESKSLIAEAQRCVNLYMERNPQDAIFPFTTYLMPGLTQTGAYIWYEHSQSTVTEVVETGSPQSAPFRGLYTASWGTLYGVLGNTLYSINSSGFFTPIGLVDNNTTVASMSDNGPGGTLVVVTGNAGWQYNPNGLSTLLAETAVAGATTIEVQAQALLADLDMLTITLDSGSTFTVEIGDVIGATATLMAPMPSQASSGNAVLDTTQTFSGLSDPAFTGATRVDFLNTYFVFSQFGSREWFISLSGSTSIDPLDFVDKVEAQDELGAVIAIHGELWVLGTSRSTEIWYQSGATDFPFAILPGTFIEHGLLAQNSLAKQDLNVFWLGQDPQGQAQVYMGSNYRAQVVSTRAMEYAIQQYATVADAIGWTMQFAGHTFYVLTFPTGDATWVYDLTTGLWSEWLWADTNGLYHRHRANCFASAYGQLWMGDWETGELYLLQQSAYTDAGDPIIRTRSWPHIVNDNKRVSYSQFIADMEIGTDGVDSNTDITLSCSNDKGRTFFSLPMQSLGAQGQWLTNPQWRRCGIARDRVFQLQWSLATETALNGAFIEVEAAET